MMVVMGSAADTQIVTLDIFFVFGLSIACGTMITLV